MRKTIVSVVAAAAALGFAGTAFAQAPTRAAAVNIVPVVAGATENAQVSLNAVVPGVAGFTATGNGSGFDATSQYISLAYGRLSVPVPTNGINPCADDGTLGDPNQSTLRMFLGAWLPVVGGNRTLAGVQAVTTLDQVNTVSIRRANVPVLPQPGDIRPQAFQIRACGLIVNRQR